MIYYCCGIFGGFEQQIKSTVTKKMRNGKINKKLLKWPHMSNIKFESIMSPGC